MTDFKTLVLMLDNAGIVYEIIPNYDSKDETDASGHPILNRITDVVSVTEQDNKKNLGYSNFYTRFFFQRETGALLAMGAWE